MTSGEVGTFTKVGGVEVLDELVLMGDEFQIQTFPLSEHRKSKLPLTTE